MAKSDCRLPVLDMSAAELGWMQRESFYDGAALGWLDGWDLPYQMHPKWARGSGLRIVDTPHGRVLELAWKRDQAIVSRERMPGDRWTCPLRRPWSVSSRAVGGTRSRGTYPPTSGPSRACAPIGPSSRV